MENKIAIIERLLEEKRITFREALVLIGLEQKSEVRDLTPPLNNYDKYKDQTRQVLIRQPDSRTYTMLSGSSLTSNILSSE